MIRLFGILRSAALLMTVASVIAVAQPQQFSPAGMGGGGALFLPAFSPHNAAEVYVSCDMSELFHSTDFGASWGALDYHQFQGGNTHGLVQFTSDPNIMYSIDGRNDLTTPMKSTDGGATWHPLQSDPTSGGAYYLYADNNSTGNIILTDYSHLYFSNNGGTTFTLKYTGSASAGCHVGGVFFDGSSIYVGTNAGLLVSSNSGGTFAIAPITGIPADEAIVSFAGAKQNGTARFFCVTLGTGDVYPGVTGAEHFNYHSIYSLDAGGTAWTQKEHGIAIGDHPFFVAMARNNISMAYVGGGSAMSAPTVYKTTDGGANWQSVMKTTNNLNIATGWSGSGGDRAWSYGEYALGFAVSPVDPNNIAISDLGFIHISGNGGTSWRQAYVNQQDENPAGSPTPTKKSYRSAGIENTTCWQVAWADSTHMIGCFSDIKGVVSADAGTSWSQNYTGHTLNSMYRVTRDASTGILYAGTSSVHDMYQSTTLTDGRIDAGAGQVLFCADKGKTWQTLHDFKHPVIWVALDPNTPKRLYASVINSTDGGIYVSSDIDKGSASTWKKLATPPRTEGHPFNIMVLKDGTLLASFAGRRTSNFTNSSGVYISTDQGATWVDRSATQMHYWTKDVMVDPHDQTEKTWYAGVFSGWGGAANGLGGLYKTTDRGVTWKKVLDRDRVTSCTISPINPDEAYATTETEGLWYTTNLNAATPTFTQVAGYPFRQPERVFYNPYNPRDIWVSSFGNGMRHGMIPTVIAPPPIPALRYPANDSTGVPTAWSLTWQQVPVASQYRVQLAASPDFATTIIDQSVTSPTRAFTGLAAKTKYYWRVKASNTGGESSWSETWSFTTADATQLPPSAPGLISPANDSTGVPVARSLYWNAVGGAETYRVQLSATADFAAPILDKNGVASTSQIFSGLAANTKYYWRVSGANGAGPGAWSPVWSFTTITDVPNPPAAPLLVSPANDSLGVPLSRSLWWSAVAGAEAYRVQLSTVQDFSTVLLDLDDRATPGAQFTGLAEMTRYYWRVAARNAGGYGTWSPVWNFTTLGKQVGVEEQYDLPRIMDLK
ncbi:MAG: BNR/Asp-box repeat protein [Chlorobi bacterium]|nr:BNR/Asp-box repeat protein [Chlorobiota bacterium]